MCQLATARLCSHTQTLSTIHSQLQFLKPNKWRDLSMAIAHLQYILPWNELMISHLSSNLMWFSGKTKHKTKYDKHFWESIALYKACVAHIFVLLFSFHEMLIDFNCFSFSHLTAHILKNYTNLICNNTFILFIHSICYNWKEESHTHTEISLSNFLY